MYTRQGKAVGTNSGITTIGATGKGKDALDWLGLGRRQGGRVEQHEGTVV